MMKKYTAILGLIVLGMIVFGGVQKAFAAPPNDNLANAQSVSFFGDSTFESQGSNVGATRQANEPEHYSSTFPGAKSVWFKWTSPVNRSVRIELAESFNALIAVYTSDVSNPTFAQLTKIESHIDVYTYYSTYARAEFLAQAGKTYYIAVDCLNQNQAETEGGFILRMMRNNLAFSSDFDPIDDRASMSVFRPGEGVWYNSNNFVGILYSSVSWGLNGDTPIPSDYNGDGKTDVAVTRNQNGSKIWYIDPAASNLNGMAWGLSTDRAVVADFDNDGRADPTAIRKSNGNLVWYARQSSNGSLRTFTYGLEADKPVLGDFDGDGASEVAVTRTSQGLMTWYMLKSRQMGQNPSYTQSAAVQFGINLDVAVAEDYDGDEQTDIAVFRPSTGVWYILRSSDGEVQIMQFGISGDKPQPADYDGDGRADMAVFRPSNGTWYVMRSGNNQPYSRQWGTGTDEPVSSLATLDDN